MKGVSRRAQLFEASGLTLRSKGANIHRRHDLQEEGEPKRPAGHLVGNRLLGLLDTDFRQGHCEISVADSAASQLRLHDSACFSLPFDALRLRLLHSAQSNAALHTKKSASRIRE